MALDTVEHIYKEIAQNGKDAQKAKDLLKCQHWYLNLFDFDPVTDEALPSDMDAFLIRISLLQEKELHPDYKYFPDDRIQKIVNYISSAVGSLFEAIHEKHIREHLVTNAAKVHETDSKALRYLSRKPGRTIRQKISVDQKMMGVFHDTSVNTAENRVLKALLYRLDNILYQKEKAFGSDSLSNEQRLFNSRIHRWLNSEEAQVISEWNNLPPNNTLLNDKNYRKIWKAFVSLQNINLDFTEDLKNLKKLEEQMEFYKTLARLNLNKQVNFNQQPVMLNLASLEIKTLFQNINCQITDEKTKVKNKIVLTKNKISSIPAELDKFLKTADTLTVKTSVLNETETAVVDITQLVPFVCKKECKVPRLRMQLKYQLWKTQELKAEYLVPGFYSNYLSQPDNKKYFEYNINEYFDSEFVEHDETAVNDLIKLAPLLAKEIAKNTNAHDCTYLVPDDTDDFSSIQKALRTSMNTAFHNASPLPRSIAFVFSEAKKGKFKPDDEIYVYDKYESRTVITRIHVNKDEKLLKSNPQTRGLVFERYPSDVIGAGKQHNKSVAKAMTFTINGNITDGVEYLEELQAKTPQIPLWKDNLPQLYMVAEVNDEEQPFFLVGKKIKPIQPKRGIARDIEIADSFVLAAGRDFYEFPLVQGSKDRKQKYFAYMTDRSFPLKNDVRCKLYLTYTYGDPLPYKLIFKPNDGSTEFEAITVQWETKSHRITDLSAPEFYMEEDWETVLKKKLKNGTTLQELNDTADVVSTISQNGWETYEISSFKTTVGWLRMPYSELEIVFFPNSIPKSQSPVFARGFHISCALVKSDRLDKNGNQQYLAFDPQFENNKPNKSNLCNKIACVLEAFNQGRTISQIQDKEVFDEILRILCTLSDSGIAILKDESFPPAIKKEAAVLLCATHEHSPEYLHEYLLNIMNTTLKDANSKDSLVHNRRIIDGIGFAIGNCKQDWQKELLDKAVLLCKNKDTKLVNFGIEILGSALWRTRNCVYMLNEEQIKILVTSLVNNVDSFVNKYFKDENTHTQLLYNLDFAKDDWRRRVTLLRSIELLLALYRLRDKNAPNYNAAKKYVAVDYFEIQKLTKTFKKLKEFLRFDKAQKGKTFDNPKEKYKNLTTRIIFEIHDASRDETLPDFMYVLEKYTKGETSGIKILKVDE